MLAPPRFTQMQTEAAAAWDGDEEGEDESSAVDSSARNSAALFRSPYAPSGTSRETGRRSTGRRSNARSRATVRGTVSGFVSAGKARPDAVLNDTEMVLSVTSARLGVRHVEANGRVNTGCPPTPCTSPSVHC